MSLYHEHLLDHATNPRHLGVLEGATHQFEAENTSCGDRLGITLRVVDNCVMEIGILPSGCAISRAAASVFAERLHGISLEEAKTLGYSDMQALLGVDVGPLRRPCAELPLRALRGILSPSVSS